MTISTLGILVHVTPTLVGNACRHYVRFLLGCGWCAPRESANEFLYLSLIHISEPTRRLRGSRMPSSA